KTCKHPERARIDLMLANGVDCVRVAKQFAVSRDSVWRHATNHLTQEQRDALRIKGSTVFDPGTDLEALKRTESEDLLQHVIHERARLQRLADVAELVGNLQDSTRASRASLEAIELTAKLLGDLRLGSTTTINHFTLSPDWHKLRSVIVRSL